MSRHVLMCLWPLLCLTSVPVWAEEPDHAIHEELRALLKTVETAINSNRFDDLLPVAAENLRVTPINQEFLNTPAALSDYFSRHFGPGNKLRSLHMTLEADALTELSPDKTWGLANGKGTEVYTLNDGRVFAMPTRWTSVVVLESDGKWRIRSMHIGTDFLDNPLLNAVEGSVKKFAIGAAVIGGLVGLIIGVLVGRRRRS